jgi:hypothetical protein
MKRWSSHRNSSVWKNILGFGSYHIIHMALHGSVLFLLAILFGVTLDKSFLNLLHLYMLIHGFIDIVKGLIPVENLVVSLDSESDKEIVVVKHKKGGELILYVLDQFLHLLVIYILIRICSVNGTSEWVYRFKYVDLELINNIQYIFVIGYVVLSGSHFVVKLLDYIYREYLRKYDFKGQSFGFHVSDLAYEAEKASLIDKNDQESSNDVLDKNEFLFKQVGVGKYIGYFERLILVIALIITNYNLVIAVVGIKTWVRHKELDYKNFSEYYLLGTLSSLIYTVLIYTIISKVFL